MNHWLLESTVISCDRDRLLYGCRCPKYLPKYLHVCHICDSLYCFIAVDGKPQFMLLVYLMAE